MYDHMHMPHGFTLGQASYKRSPLLISTIITKLAMSFKTPALRRKRSTKSSAIASGNALVDMTDIRRDRRPFPDLQTPSGAFVQVVPTPRLQNERSQAGDGINEPIALQPEETPGSPSKHGDKKAKQWKRWMEDVIPALLGPFLTVLRESSSLRDVRRDSQQCDCGSPKIDVVGVYFESKISFCMCSLFLS